jgi:hypothetical protein
MFRKKGQHELSNNDSILHIQPMLPFICLQYVLLEHFFFFKVNSFQFVIKIDHLHSGIQNIKKKKVTKKQKDIDFFFKKRFTLAGFKYRSSEY